MRMWMVNPKILCQKHLGGEHVECHMFVSVLKKGTNINGYINNNLLEPKSLYKRHLELENEMRRRGFNCNSIITEDDCNEAISKIKNQTHFDYIVNSESSLMDLLSRCPVCKIRHDYLLSDPNWNDNSFKLKHDKPVNRHVKNSERIDIENVWQIIR